MMELLEDLAVCLDRLLADLETMSPAFQDASVRHLLEQGRGRLTEAHGEAIEAARVLRLVKMAGRLSTEPGPMEPSAPLASFDTISDDSRN